MPESIIRKILNRIKWDSQEDVVNYEITFLHRGAPDDLKTYPAERIKEIKGSYLLFVDVENDEGEVIIPFHRLRRIYNKKTNELVWVKEP